jgi:2Fe-2S ferredoxin
MSHDDDLERWKATEDEPHAEVRFTRDGTVVRVKVGCSLLHAGWAHGVVMQSSCGEVCACSTCHVWVDQGGELLTPPGEEEEDCLDKAPLLKAGSRLSCQAKIRRAGKLVISFPPGTHERMGH